MHYPPDALPPHWQTGWRSLRRILCVRLDSLGDVLMTTPALTALKAAHPDCHLTLMTSQAGAAVTPLLSDVDDVLVYDAPWLKATAPRASSQPEFDWVQKLSDRAFDAAIIFTVYSQSPLPAALLTYLANIPLRLAHCRENPYQLLTHAIRDPEPDRYIRHETQRQLDLVASVGCVPADARLRVQISPAAHRSTAARLARLGLDRRPWFVLHAGASAPSRRYPPDQFAQVAQQISRLGLMPVFTGTAAEQPLVNSIRQQVSAPTISLVGQLDLAELAALIAAAPLLLTNNTGPVHLAAAVGTPVVDLYALTNLQHTPWQVPHRVLFHDVPCRLCYKSVCPEGHHDCLRQVSPQQVVDAVVELLAGKTVAGYDSMLFQRDREIGAVSGVPA